MIDMDLHFGSTVVAVELVQSLLKSGASLVANDSIRFHLTDDFDWETRPASDIDEVVSALQMRAEAGNTVGVDIYFDGSSFGGALLIPGDSTVVYFILPNDRATIESTEFTDFSWYLSRIIRPFGELGMTGFECHDFYPN
ncbi:hypothetical protein ACFO5K_08230 [Nocardia halotolerans]|uniref:Immunity protein Imm1 n=1 Tax=Nocardia halotolerans TaxID=1755878 RepID=A0ABV8VEQ9_9NOCA